jgi:magnesium-transporting ATPase (P-type)
VEPGAVGLSSAEARARLARVGPNVLPAIPAPGLPQVVLRQLRSPLVYVLIAAAGVSLALADFNDAAFIGLVLVVNSALGAWQEWKAERQSRSLQRLLRVRATAVRDGLALEIDAEQLVPGDVVLLESGQRVPADLRLLDARGLSVDESLLTGESVPVSKQVCADAPDHAPLTEWTGRAWAGTAIVRGRARAEVVATGPSTAVGRLAIAMGSTPGGRAPLVERMESFARRIAVVVIGAVVALGVAGVMLRGESIATMFLFAVALAVSAIPEGLPVALTVTLAIASHRMAGRGAIVRSLPAVEGLGSCTMIATDKTGTLTCNELTVRELSLPDGTTCTVDGSGHEPVGAILVPRGDSGSADPRALRRLLEVCAGCNEAELACVDGTWHCRGDPTDVALLVLAGKGGVDRRVLCAEWPEVAAVPFEAAHRYAATEHRRSGTAWIAVKGAPERVLAMCRLEPGAVAGLLARADDMAERGLRVLALASGTAAEPGGALASPQGPAGLEFAGLVGLIDPLRPGARAAVGRCAEAGIRVVMVTGDHPATALAIAREAGIARGIDDVVTGASLAECAGAEFDARVAGARVFARVSPEQKLAIVSAAQRAGHYVAVTGDGVNDAPALRQANIGVAMGRGGTDAAREAADLVLADDDFATIAAGVEQGRIAYRNVRSVVYLLVAAGIAEVVTVALAVLAGLPLPLLPVQLLWLNLVTNGVQDVALAFEAGRGDEMRSMPRRPGEPLLDRLMIGRGVTAGLWMALIGFAWFAARVQGGEPVADARNELLLLMVLMQNADAFNARSETQAVFHLPLSSNPLLAGGVAAALALHVCAMYFSPLRSVLELSPPAAREWIALPLLAMSLLVVMELQRRWRSSRCVDAAR